MNLALATLNQQLRKYLSRLSPRYTITALAIISIGLLLGLIWSHGFWVLIIIVSLLLVGGVIGFSIIRISKHSAPDPLKLYFAGVKAAARQRACLYKPCYIVVGEPNAQVQLSQWATPFRLSSEPAKQSPRVCEVWLGDKANFIILGEQVFQQQTEVQWRCLLKHMLSFTKASQLQGILLLLECSNLLAGEQVMECIPPEVLVRLKSLEASLGRTLPCYYHLIHFDKCRQVVESAACEHLAEAVDRFEVLVGVDAYPLRPDALVSKTHCFLSGLYHILWQGWQQYTYAERCAQHELLLRLNRIMQVLHTLIHSDSSLHCAGVWFAKAEPNVKTLDSLTRHSKSLLHTRQCKRQQLKQKIVWFACWMPLVVALLFYPMSCRQEQQRVVEISHAVSQQWTHSQKILQVYQLIQSTQHWPWPVYWGVDRRGRLLAYLEPYLDKSLLSDYLQPVKRCLIRSLVHFIKHKPEDQPLGKTYSEFVAYQLLVKPSDLPLSQCIQWSLPVWRRCLQLQGNQWITTTLIRPWLRYFFRRSLFPLTADQSVLVHMRQRLKKADYSHLLLAQLEYLASQQHEPVKLQTLLQTSDSWHSNYAVPSLYVRDGFNQWVKSILNTVPQQLKFMKSILNSVRHRAQREDIQFQRHLIRRYANQQYRHWLRLLDSLELQLTSGLDSESAEPMISKQSLKTLFQRLAQQFPWQSQKFTHQSNGTVIHALLEFSRTLKNTKLAGIPAWHKQAQEQMLRLQQLMESIHFSADPNQRAVELSKRMLKHPEQSELGKLYHTDQQVLSHIADRRLAALLKPLLIAPIKSVWQILLHHAGLQIQKDWQQKFYPGYKHSLAQHFPFKKQGDDADLMVMQNYLQPQSGELWLFINTQLTHYLVQSAGRFQRRTWLGLGLPLSKQFLSTLSNTLKFSNTLFPPHSNRPSIQFAFQFKAHPNISEIRLLSQGQTVAYRNGPIRWQTLSWPGPKPFQDAALATYDSHHQLIHLMSQPGAWGILHLLAHAKPIRLDQHVYQLSWSIKKPSGAVTIRALVNAPLDLLQKMQINLPEKIMRSSG